MRVAGNYTSTSPRNGLESLKPLLADGPGAAKDGDTTETSSPARALCGVASSMEGSSWRALFTRNGTKRLGDVSKGIGIR